MKGSTAKRTAFLGLVAALAALMGYVEALIPIDFGIPGIKLGLCNIVIVIVLYFYSWKEAMLISTVRILIIGFLFGNLFSIVYSTAGMLLSIFCMSILKKSGLFSEIGVSSAGGTAHNLGQLCAACLIVKGIPFLGYAPLLMLSGCAAGCAIGFLAKILKRHLREVIS